MIDKPGIYHGAASSIFILVSAQEEDEGDYRCVIDNYLVTQAAELSIDMLATIPYHRML